GTSVERRVFQRRYHFRHLRLELRDPSLRLLELLLSAAQLLARVLPGFWRDALMLVDLPQRLFLGGGDRRGMGALGADFFPLREAARELGHAALVQNPNPRRQGTQQRPRSEEHTSELQSR